MSPLLIYLHFQPSLGVELMPPASMSEEEKKLIENYKAKRKKRLEMGGTAELHGLGE